MTTPLPHDDYIHAVAVEIANYGIDVTDAFTTSPDGEQLDAVLRFADKDVDADTWTDGVYLGWDQYGGWVLTETGGGRNVTDLDPSAVFHQYASPQQVAYSTAAQLRGGGVGGPVTSDRAQPWDYRELQAAVEAWGAADEEQLTNADVIGADELYEMDRDAEFAHDAADDERQADEDGEAGR